MGSLVGGVLQGVNSHWMGSESVDGWGGSWVGDGDGDGDMMVDVCLEIWKRWRKEMRMRISINN